MGVYNETRSLVDMMAGMETAIEKLERANAKLDAKIQIAQDLRERNSEQIRRLQLGFAALKNTTIRSEEPLPADPFSNQAS